MGSCLGSHSREHRNSPSPPEGNGDSVENVSCDDEDEDEERGDRGEEEDGVQTLESTLHHLAGAALRHSAMYPCNISLRVSLPLSPFCS